jgi:hypothetical protein
MSRAQLVPIEDDIAGGAVSGFLIPQGSNRCRCSDGRAHPEYSGTTGAECDAAAIKAA